MVCFIKDEKIDIIDRYKGVHQALIEYLCRAHNDLVLSEMFCPDFFRPEIAAHFSTETFNFLIQIAFEYCELLENKCHTIHLKGN